MCIHSFSRINTSLTLRTNMVQTHNVAEDVTNIFHFSYLFGLETQLMILVPFLLPTGFTAKSNECEETHIFSSQIQFTSLLQCIIQIRHFHTRNKPTLVQSSAGVAKISLGHTSNRGFSFIKRICRCACLSLYKVYLFV